MNFLFVLYDVRQKEGTLLYYGASSCADIFCFSDVGMSVPGPIFFDCKILDEISWG